jgi:hypothetical protein
MIRNRRLKTNEEMAKERAAMREAVAAYNGPVTKCPAGKARGRPVQCRMPKAEARTAKFLRRHADEPTDQAVEAKRLRHQRRSIEKRNASLLARVGKEENTIKRELALIKQIGW